MPSEEAYQRNQFAERSFSCVKFSLLKTFGESLHEVKGELSLETPYESIKSKAALFLPQSSVDVAAAAAAVGAVAPHAVVPVVAVLPELPRPSRPGLGGTRSQVMAALHFSLESALVGGQARPQGAVTEVQRLLLHRGGGLRRGRPQHVDERGHVANDRDDGAGRTEFPLVRRPYGGERRKIFPFFRRRKREARRRRRLPRRLPVVRRRLFGPRLSRCLAIISTARVFE